MKDRVTRKYVREEKMSSVKATERKIKEENEYRKETLKLSQREHFFREVRNVEQRF